MPAAQQQIYQWNLMNWYIRIRGYWTITGLHLDIRTVKPCFHFLQAGTHSHTHTHSVLQILRWSQYSNFKLLQVFLQHGSNDYFLSCRCCHSAIAVPVRVISLPLPSSASDIEHAMCVYSMITFDSESFDFVTYFHDTGLMSCFLKMIRWPRE